MANSAPVLSVLKALDILRAVAESEHPMELGEIARLMGMKAPTCYNLLRSLALRGYISRSTSGGYVLGPAPEELVRRGSRRTLFRMGGVLLQRAAEEYPEATLTFSELTADAVCCRLRVSPDRPGELQHPSGQFFQPYFSVSAVCLQSMAEDAGLFEANFPFEEYGGKWYRSLQQYRQEQRKIRQTGYFFRTPDSDGIVAAIYIGRNCSLGFRDHAADETALPRLQKLIGAVFEAGDPEKIDATAKSTADEIL